MGIKEGILPYYLINSIDSFYSIRLNMINEVRPLANYKRVRNYAILYHLLKKAIQDNYYY
jgi:hypothetical protein